MAGFLSFLFLLLVIWALLSCAHALLRLIGESLFPGAPDDLSATMMRERGGADRLCRNPHCRKDNRGGARFCARCGEPLAAGIATDRAA